MIKKSRWNMRKIAKEIAVGLIILVVVSQVVNYLRKPELVSDKLPAIEATLIDGTKFVTPKDRILVIYFWGSWCPVCKLEASNIQALSQKYDVLTIAVNSGSDKEIAAYMSKKGLDYQVINDRSGKYAKEFDVEVFPTTFIYDAKGDLRFSEIGYVTTVGLMARMAMLKESQ
jgi:thiol-disulfide isomerase/thioredoxin